MRDLVQYFEGPVFGGGTLSSGGTLEAEYDFFILPGRKMLSRDIYLNALASSDDVRNDGETLLRLDAIRVGYHGHAIHLAGFLQFLPLLVAQSLLIIGFT